MKLKYYSASQIHNGKQWLPQGSVIAISDDGTVMDVLSENDIPAADIIHLEGVLCPGFVNAHCHIELSHMKGVVKEGTGLVPFLQSVVSERNKFTEEDKQAGIVSALKEMRENGIVAVGDIANGTDTLPYRTEADFHIHTFVEALGFSNENIEQRFAWPENVYRQFAAQQSVREGQILRQSIVPHAPYSVSEGMFKAIDGFDEGSLISIHNEETAAENEFYEEGTGQMFELYETLKIDAGFFEASGKTSLQTYLPWLAKSHPLMLVHNTFMNAEDVKVLKESGREFYLCVCPNANWYIEQRMPPVKLFMESGLPVCLGTDSYSSNHELNIWSEIECIQKYFPEIGLEILLTWATYNGAKALQMNTIGLIEKGKRPGLVLIRENKIERIL
ncbi:amidohydrolase family protein [Taibaiella lutea]|nr:amidohydrolase family protein [Taibaiella lutea]